MHTESAVVSSLPRPRRGAGRVRSAVGFLLLGGGMVLVGFALRTFLLG